VSRFTGAVAAELVKVRTVRGLVLGATLATLAVPLTSLLVVTSGGLGERDTLTSGAATGTVVGLLAFGAWGAAVAGSEYVHRTITVALSTVPHRWTLLGAKLTAAGVIGVVGGLVSAALSLLLVSSAAPAHTHDLGNPPALGGIALATGAVAVVGVAVGALLRSSTASIAVVAAAILLPKAAADLLGGLQPWVVGASPGTVVTQLVGGAQLAPEQTFPGGTAAAVLAMLGVAALVALGSGTAFGRRDG
jgi:hypothetical protein